MIPAVFFDLDGTLLDTAADLAGAINLVLAKHGHPPVSFSQFRYQVHGGSEKMLCHGFGITPDDSIFSLLKLEFFNAYRGSDYPETQLFPGMDRVLQTIREANGVWGIITNKPFWLAQPLIARFRELDDAQCFLAGDSLAKRKPDPAPLLRACELVGCDPTKSIYIGDTKHDIVAAQAAKMKSIAVRYGYHREGVDLDTWQADFIVDSAEEIINCLQKLTT